MSALIGYIMRLVGYALLVGIPARLAEYYWERASLDQTDALQQGHAVASTVVLVVPFILALFGFGAMRRLAVFIALYIGGAVLTAPFALARLAMASP